MPLPLGIYRPDRLSALPHSRKTQDFALTMQYAQIHVAKVHTAICKIEEYLYTII
jgi:hypothetical protein